MRKIQTFVKQTRIYFLTAVFIRYALIWLSFALFTFAFLAVLRLFGVPSHGLKQFFHASIAVSTAAGVFLYIFANLKHFGAAGIILYIQQRIPELGDSLLTSWQLNYNTPPGTSRELAEEQINSTSRRLSALSPAGIIPFEKMLFTPGIFLSAALALNLLAYAVNPSKVSDFMKNTLSSSGTGAWALSFSVSPGSAIIPWGNPVNIEAAGKLPLNGEPELRIKKDKWEKLAFTRKDEGTFSFMISRLTEKLEYCVLWDELRTENFTLTPEAPPQLGNYEIKYTYPEYTGMPVHTVKGNPNVSAPAGSSVDIKAVSNKELSKAALASSWKTVYPAAVKNNKVSASFRLRQSGTYKFLIEDLNGVSDSDPPEYAVFITPDRAPEIELLTPSQDLIVSPDDEIPLVIQATDDFGLTQTDLVCKIGGREQERVTIDRPPKNTYSKTFEFRWKLKDFDVRAGDKIIYHLEAWDNDTVNGPKFSATDPLSIETTDYEIEHKKIEKDLESFRKELLRILADQTAAKERLAPVSLQFTSTGYALLAEGQKKVKNGFKSPLASLSGIIERMEADPYTDYSTFSEYKGMLEHVDYLDKKPAVRALEAIGNKNWDDTEKQQNEIIAVLEKLTLLSEDIWQYQKMRDLFDSGSELEKNSSELLDMIKNRKAQPEELKRSLEKINELLEKISRQLSDMPHELPEDFINSPAVKQLDLNKAKSLAERLRDAIDKGDYELAQELAAQMQEQLQEMLATMQKAGESVGFSKNSSQILEQKLLEQKIELDRIIKNQEKILGETEKLDEKRREALFKKQENLLGQLAEKQKGLIREKERVRSQASARIPHFDPLTQQTNKLMNMVLEEFEKKRVYYSQKYLEDIIKDMETEKGLLSGNPQALGQELSAHLAEKTREVSEGEKEILSQLKQKLSENMFSQGEENKMRALGKEQNDLSDATLNFRKSLEEFARESTAVPPEAFESLDGAAGDMKDASAQLNSKDTPSALESGREALEKLQSGFGQLQAASEQMEGEAGNSGKPVSGSIQVRSAGGMKGVRAMPVKLPGIEEYRPPKEFRQDILDALREKYPKEFDKIIKDYYKRLTE
ncbi:MAG: DUF4175 family protein [Elusimicrobiota bacterium]